LFVVDEVKLGMAIDVVWGEVVCGEEEGVEGG
jgi:hypothetical protein